MEFRFSYLFAVIWLLINVIVSIQVARRDDLDAFQKKGQIVFVWIIPFLAAIFVWHYNRSMDLEVKRGNGTFGGGESPVDHE